MAYKESNPVMAPIVMHIILLSIFGIFWLYVALTSLNGVIAVLLEDMDVIIPSLAVGYVSIFCNLPFLIPVFIIVVYSISLIRRSVYGEKHAKSTLKSFFFGIFGMIIPTVLGVILLMFTELVNNIYVIMPFFLHMVPIAFMYADYLFIKDIGGRNKGFIAFILFTISSALMAVNAFIALAYSINHDMTELVIGLLFLAEMLLAIAALIAIIIMIRAYVDAKNWSKKHKPLIDTQQKQQLEMQQNQIKMQIEQLKLQQEQLELQKQSMDMLSEMRQDTISGGNEMLSERSTSSRYVADNNIDEYDNDHRKYDR